MITLDNINKLSSIELFTRFRELTINFPGAKSLSWKPFLALYQDPELTTIKENLTDIKAKLFNIDNYLATYPSGDMPDAPLTKLIEELNTAVNNLPDPQRRHIENAIKEEAKKQGLDLVTIKTPQKSESHNPTEPLNIHMAGTEVSGTFLGDPLAASVRQQPNFFIQAGVSDRYRGKQGQANVDTVFEHIRSIYNPPNGPPANKRINLTGFSRGAATIPALANKIHQEFNYAGGQEKPENEWVKIDMFLVDPTFGAIDSKTSATQTYDIPPCVNTVNILYADPKAAPERWFHRFFTRHTRDILKFDSQHTTVQTMNLRGGHTAVGLMDRILGKRLSSYFVEAMCRLFLGRAGRETAPSNEPKLNSEYIKNNIIAKNQTSALQYYSSFTSRLATDNLNKTDANALQFSATIPQYSIPADTAPKEQQYHNLLMQMYGGIIEGDYKVRFGGVQQTDRAQSKMPSHMYKMCEAIETYCNNLKDGKKPSAETTFNKVRTIAHDAQKNQGVLNFRKDNVKLFYKEVASADINKAIDSLKSPKPGK